LTNVDGGGASTAEAPLIFEQPRQRQNVFRVGQTPTDPRQRRMLGNFPQALTHMALINTARLLSMPAHEVERAGEKGEQSGVAAHASETWTTIRVRSALFLPRVGRRPWRAEFGHLRPGPAAVRGDEIAG